MHTHAHPHTVTIGDWRKEGKNKATASLHTQKHTFTRRCLLYTVSPTVSPLTTHTHTQRHISVLAFRWNYRSDFSIVEMQEDDSDRLNQRAMNQCLIKPLALGMNCQHRKSTHSLSLSLALSHPHAHHWLSTSSSPNPCWT